MRYQRPFTLAQRQQAITACRAFRAQLSTIRSRYRPSTPEQRDVARQLRRIVEDFIAALRVPDAKVDVKRVNELRELADELGVEYAALRLRQSGR